MKEVWIPIKESKKYKISNLGEIKNLNYKNSGKEKILKQTISPKGYKTINLREKGKKYSQMVHKLMAEAFIPNPDNLPQVNHKDGNKERNIIDIENLYGDTTNLEWVNNSGNQKHAYKLGLRTAKRGKQNILSKKIEQYDLKGNFIKLWDSISEANKELKIPNGSISAVCKGKMKQTGGYKWKYHKDVN